MPEQWIARVDFNVDILPLTEADRTEIVTFLNTIACETDKGEHRYAVRMVCYRVSEYLKSRTESA